MDDNDFDTSALDAAAAQDELIMQKHREIEQEIGENSLIGYKENLSRLEEEYITDAVYLAKIKDLQGRYKYLRRTRPDGNCFYRAFAYGYFEYLLTNPAHYEAFRERVEKCNKSMIECGFPRLTLEDFHDTFLEILDVVGKGVESLDDLYQLFNEQGQSDYIVVYLRLITSCQLQSDAEFYQNFVDGERSILEFCQQEVEPMYKESDHLHITALSTALDVGIRVRYMDRGLSTSECTAHDFGSDIRVHLLYKPGHYDILYPLDGPTTDLEEKRSVEASL